MDIVHFVNNSLDNLVKNVVKHGFYHLNQEFNANVLDWKKDYPTKMNYIIH